MESLKLLTPFKIGDLEFQNRVVMAALTRIKCDKQTHVPNDLVAEYYANRATAGLILTECTAIRPDGDSFPGCAHIQTDEQVEGWKKVIDQVHARGGKIAIQIWHGGRAVHPDHFGGETTLGPSAIAINGTVHTPTKHGRVQHVAPREATLEDIKQLIRDFRIGAENAKKAGFDAIELHGAHGYIIDSFLRDSANKRTDDYGGSIENRARLCLEVLDELIAVFGPERTGIKLSPLNCENSMSDSDPFTLMEYLMEQFNARKLGFLEVNEAIIWDDINGDKYKAKVKEVYGDRPYQTMRHGFRSKFNGAWIANFGFKRDTAEAAIQEGSADMVAFGNLYCQNDNLVEKFAKGIKPVGDDETTFPHLFKTYYAEGPLGYTDLSIYEELENKRREEKAQQ